MEARRAQRILVVDDDVTVAGIVTRFLERAGFVADSEGDGDRAWKRIEADPPDLVVLDLMLPGLNGFEICRRLGRQAHVPTVVISARGEESIRVMGHELGADDHVVKPVSPRELVARVKSVLRRAAIVPPADGERPSELLTARALEVDVAAHRVTRDGSPVRLTNLEFELLVFLMRNPERVFGREELLERVWGYDFGGPSTVTVHMHRLRRKIEADPGSPGLIKTVWGVGYRFEPEEGHPPAAADEPAVRLPVLRPGPAAAGV